MKGHPATTEASLTGNVRFVDLPEVVTMAAERTPVVVYASQPDAFSHTRETAAQLGWDKKQFRLRQALAD